MTKQESCQCEHESHFNPKVFSPNGNPHHKAYAKYFERYMRTVNTPYGSFRICKDCAEDCYQDYVKGK